MYRGVGYINYRRALALTPPLNRVVCATPTIRPLPLCARCREASGVVSHRHTMYLTTACDLAIVVAPLSDASCAAIYKTDTMPLFTHECAGAAAFAKHATCVAKTLIWGGIGLRT